MKLQLISAAAMLLWIWLLFLAATFRCGFSFSVTPVVAPPASSTVQRSCSDLVVRFGSSKSNEQVTPSSSSRPIDKFIVEQPDNAEKNAESQEQQQQSGQDTLEPPRKKTRSSDDDEKILEEESGERLLEESNTDELVWLGGTVASTKGPQQVTEKSSQSNPDQQQQRKQPSSQTRSAKEEEFRLELQWCNSEDVCKDTIRERVVASGQSRNNIVLTGPATGQVAYNWVRRPPKPTLPGETTSGTLVRPRPSRRATATQSVLLLIRPGDEVLLQVAAKAVQEWISPRDDEHEEDNDDTKESQTIKEDDNDDDAAIEVWLDPSVAARLEHYYGVRSEGRIQLFEGAILESPLQQPKSRSLQPLPDLICTLGGDGLLMHAGLLFQGPVPPILCVAGGSLGFLTPFQTDEMVDAVRLALGLVSSAHKGSQHNNSRNPISSSTDLNVYPPNMPSYPYEPLQQSKSAFGLADRLCLSIRMRLCCRILNRQGVCRAEFNVLNEVVIDRGSSPYLAALECFCDDSHLTTVQADGIIFATPTGSTAYSMAAGGSVVHPAVPSILVTPICPHVLSFRSMIFPDSVVLQCVVPDDARSEASVAFDGKHRQPLHRGDCLEVTMSNYPVPTLNRLDHSSDWLSSLKRNFGFNARPRQRPLSSSINKQNNSGYT